MLAGGLNIISKNYCYMKTVGANVIKITYWVKRVNVSEKREKNISRLKN